MSERRCNACGAQATRRHHITGAEGDRRLFDPTLTSDLCHDCHEAEHDRLRLLGLDEPSRPLAGSERVEWRLRRLAVHLDTLRTTPVLGPLLGSIADTLTRLADELRSERNENTGWTRPEAQPNPAT